MSSIDYKKMKVLVIDDFEEHLNNMKKILKAIGFEDIDLAQRASTAINYCKKVNYDIILSDYNLGDGKNGQQILEEIKFSGYLKETSAFIMITAETTREMVLSAIEIEPDGYIVKPFNQQMLCRKINRLLKHQEILYNVNTAIDKGEYEKAIKACSDIIINHPKYETHCLKIQANLYYKLAAYEKAAEIYESALEKRTVDWAQLGKAKVLYALKEYDKAIDELKALIERNKSCVLAYDLLADCYRDTGDPSASQSTLEKAIAISPISSKRQSELGDMAVMTGDLNTASTAYRKTVKFSRHSIFNSSNNYFKLARSLTDGMVGNLSAADFEKSKEVQQVFKDIRNQYESEEGIELQTKMIETRLLVNQQEPEQAINNIKKIEELLSKTDKASDTDICMDLALTYKSIGDEDKCNEVLNEINKETQDHKSLDLKVKSIQKNIYIEGKRNKVIQINDDGTALYNRGNYEDAIKLFSSAVKMIPKNVTVNLNIIQSALKIMEEKGRKAKYEYCCDECFSRIGNLSKDNQQYERFTTLKKEYDKLIGKQ